MNWKSLEDVGTVTQLQEKSRKRPVIIFKHSTRCSISSMALSRLERAWNEQDMEGADIFYLDLIRHRDVSQKVAESFRVPHQSPQLLLIRNEQCVYNTSHLGISYRALKEQIDQL
jgi:bacillithiol system protein YtxJ